VALLGAPYIYEISSLRVNRGNERVAACSISRATGLSLATAATNGTQGTYGRARPGDDRSIFTLYNKRPLLVIAHSCAYMLAIFLPNVVSSSTRIKSHVKGLIFCPI